MSAEASERFVKRLDETNIAPIITEGNDIEWYFINADHLSTLNPALSVPRAQQLIDQATEETRDKSLEAIVNLRTEEAFRRRQQGEGPPNHGAIATQANTDYVANPVGLRRGKVVLARLKQLLQQELHGNVQIFLPSAFLTRPEIRAIGNDIWPEIQR